MKKNLYNSAFIDNQNVYKAIKELKWNIDWKKFRIYLKEKYQVHTAYMFIGYINENQPLYSKLQKAGFILIFKEILKYKDGTIKGNVDAELVLQAMIDFNKYEKAIIVTGDGDFACLIRHLKKKNKLKKLLVPNIKKYSCLLKKNSNPGDIESLCVLKKKLEKIKSTP